MKKIFIPILFLCYSTVYSQDNRGYIVGINDPAPHFKITNKDDTFSLKDHLGKVIMLQFTASWCSVCIKEMPFIENEIWQIHKNNNAFVLLGLAKDTKQRAQKEKEIDLMINRTGVTYPIMTDEDSRVFNLFAEKKAGVTRNVIIDQNGNIAFLTRLFDREEFNEMKNVIEELLQNKH
ncbi:MAG: redoxin [Flavobacteriales bacterium]|nr:redoxin [Flavobacteriales bacterium]